MGIWYVSLKVNNSFKMKSSVLLLILFLLLTRTNSPVSAATVLFEDFNDVNLDDMDLSGWDYQDGPTIEVEHGFTLVDGALKAPSSSSILNRSVMNLPSTIANGTWSFDLTIESNLDTHYAVDYMWTDLTGSYDYTGLDGFNSFPWSGYSLSILSHEFDGAIIDGPGLSAIAYDDSLIRGFETIKYHPIPTEKMHGTHHIDITRDLNGLTLVYFDYEYQFNFTDTRTKNSEKFSIQSWMGGASIDNIRISDTIDEIGIVPTDLSNNPSNEEVDTSIIKSQNNPDKNARFDEFLVLPSPSIVMLGVLGSIIAAGFIGYFVIYKPRSSREALIISQRIKQEISSVFQNRTSLFYLILSKKNLNESLTEDEIARTVPKELFEHKFLMHPIRLAITKLLAESVDMTSTELKNSLDLSWGDYSTHIKALKKENYIHIREEFRDNLLRQVISITEIGNREYLDLLSVLQDFVSNSSRSIENE